MDLEEVDISTIEEHKTVTSLLCHIPVMVVEKMPAKNNQKPIKYKVCTKHGNVDTTFTRNQLVYREQYTILILEIDVTTEGLKDSLTVKTLTLTHRLPCY
jgi:hypothetical protein